MKYRCPGIVSSLSSHQVNDLLLPLGEAANVAPPGTASFIASFIATTTNFRAAPGIKSDVLIYSSRANEDVEAKDLLRLEFSFISNSLSSYSVHI